MRRDNVHWSRLLLVCLMAMTGCPSAHAGDISPAEFEKIAKANICKAAKKDLDTAESNCSDAKKACTKSIKDARESCEAGCDSTKDTAVALCNRQDAAVQQSCKNFAIDAQTYCIRGCKTSDTVTTECNSVDGICAKVATEKTNKEQACK